MVKHMIFKRLLPNIYICMHNKSLNECKSTVLQILSKKHQESDNQYSQMQQDKTQMIDT
jgi:hypothetical protein